jgi:hypothetical protein
MATKHRYASWPSDSAWAGEHFAVIADLDGDGDRAATAVGAGVDALDVAAEAEAHEVHRLSQ